MICNTYLGAGEAKSVYHIRLCNDGKMGSPILYAWVAVHGRPRVHHQAPHDVTRRLPMGVTGEPLAGGDHHLAGKRHLSRRLGGGVLLLRAGLKPLHVHALWVRLLHVLGHPMHRRWASPRLQSTRGMLHNYTSSRRTGDLTSTISQNAWREYKLMSQRCYQGSLLGLSKRLTNC